MIFIINLRKQDEQKKKHKSNENRIFGLKKLNTLKCLAIKKFICKKNVSHV